MDEKIEKTRTSLKDLEQKVEYYERKYHDISRNIHLEEINEIRDEINLKKVQRKEEMKLKMKKDSLQRQNKTQTNQTNQNEQIEQANSEEVLMILDLDNPDTFKILNNNF